MMFDQHTENVFFQSNVITSNFLLYRHPRQNCQFHQHASVVSNDKLNKPFCDLTSVNVLIRIDQSKNNK